MLATILPSLRVNNSEYIIKRRIGSIGLFASAYLAQNKQLESVVVKFLHPSWLLKNSETEILGRFVREALILDFLEEKHVLAPVRLKGISPSCVDLAFPEERKQIEDLREKYRGEKAGIDILSFLAKLELENDESSEKKFNVSAEPIARIPGGLPYLVIEYIDDSYKHLGQLISRDLGVELRVGLEISCQFALMLKDIHALNMAYLDLKEDHIFWDGKNIRVIDWNASLYKKGIAEQEKENSSLLEKQREDVYLFAKLMYHLFTGREYIDLLESPATFRKEGVTLSNLVASIDSGTSLDFGNTENRIPFAVKVILEHALAQKTEKRYEDISSLYKDLKLAQSATAEWGNTLNINLELVSKLGQKADGKRAQGIPALRTQEYTEAISKFKESLFFAPSFETAALYLEAYLRLNGNNKAAGEVVFAGSLLERDDYSSAISSLKKSTEREINQFAKAIEQIVNLLSEANRYRETGEFNKATNAYLQILLNDYRFEIARKQLDELMIQDGMINRIQTAISEENFESAKLLLEEYKSDQKTNPLFRKIEADIQSKQYFKRAILHIQKDRFKLAEEEAKKALDIKDDNESRELADKASRLVSYQVEVEDALPKGNYGDALIALKYMSDLAPDSEWVSNFQKRASEEKKIYDSIKLLADAGQKALSTDNVETAYEKYEQAHHMLLQPTTPGNALFSKLDNQVSSELEKLVRSREVNQKIHSALYSGNLDDVIKYAEQSNNNDLYKKALEIKNISRRMSAAYASQKYGEALDQLQELKQADLLKDKNIPWVADWVEKISEEYNAFQSVKQSVSEGIHSAENSQWVLARNSFSEAIKNAESLPSSEEMVNLKKQAEELLISTQKFEQYLNDAKVAVSAGDFKKAIELANKCLAIYSNNKDAQILLDSASQNQRQWEFNAALSRKIADLFDSQQDIDSLIQEIAQLPKTFNPDNKTQEIIDTARKLKTWIDKAKESLKARDYGQSVIFSTLFCKEWPNNPQIKEILASAEKQKRELEEIEQAKTRVNEKLKKATEFTRAKNYSEAIKTLEGEDDPRCAQFSRVLKILQQAIVAYHQADYDWALSLYDELSNVENLADLLPPESEDIRGRLSRLQDRQRNQIRYGTLIGEFKLDDVPNLLEKMSTAFPNDPWVKEMREKYNGFVKLIESIDDFLKQENVQAGNLLVSAQVSFQTGVLKEADFEVQRLLTIYETLLNANQTCREGTTEELERAKNDINRLLPLLRGIKKLAVIASNILEKVNKWQDITIQIDKLIDNHQYDNALEILNSLELKGYGPLNGYLKKQRFGITNQITQNFDRAIDECIDMLVQGDYDKAIALRNNNPLLQKRTNSVVDANTKLKSLASRFTEISRELTSESLAWYDRIRTKWEDDLVSFIENILAKEQFENAPSSLIDILADLRLNLEKARNASKLDPENQEAAKLLGHLNEIDHIINSFRSLACTILSNYKLPKEDFDKALRVGYYPENVKNAIRKFAVTVKVLQPSYAILAKEWEAENYRQIIDDITTIENAIKKDYPWFSVPGFLREHQQDAKEALKLVQEGNDYYRTRRYEEAFAKFSDLIDIRMKYENFVKQFTHGIMLPISVEKLRQECEKIIASAKSLANDFANGLQKNDYSTARKKLAGLQKLYPSWHKLAQLNAEFQRIAQSCFENANSLYAQKDYKGAKKAYQDVLKLDPGNGKAWRAVWQLNFKIWLKPALTFVVIILILAAVYFLSTTYIVPHQETPIILSTASPTLTRTLTVTNSNPPTKTETPQETSTLTPTPTPSFYDLMQISGMVNTKTDYYPSPIINKKNKIDTLAVGQSLFICGSYTENKSRMYLISITENCHIVNGWVMAMYITLETIVGKNNSLPYPIKAIASLGSGGISTFKDNEEKNNTNVVLPPDKIIFLCQFENDHFLYYSDINNNCQHANSWVRANQIALIIPAVESIFLTPTSGSTLTPTP